MKRLITLAILAVFVFGLAGVASAVDIEAKGQFQFQANMITNGDFVDNNAEDDLNFWFRARTQFRFITSENLMAELYLEYRNRLGDAQSTVGTGAANRDLGVKRAYLQYRFPGTDVVTTAGILSINMPGAAAGNMVTGDLDAGAFVVETPITDQIAFSVGYVRAYDAFQDDGGGINNFSDEIDLFYTALPITIDGLEVKPYFAYALIGEDTPVLTGLRAPSVAGGAMAYADDADAWWFGTSFSLTMFDPFVFNADLVYGDLSAENSANDRSGFGFDASFAYTGFDFVQPKLVFAYTTGEDDDISNGSERLPTVNNDWAFGSFYFGGSALTAADLDDADQQGFWVVGLSLEQISFFDKLTHDLHFLYIQGTNDEDLLDNPGATNLVNNPNFLTTDDHAIEIDFNTNYQIYDELAAIAEFGYVNMDRDRAASNDADAFKFAVGLVYAF